MVDCDFTPWEEKRAQSKWLEQNKLCGIQTKNAYLVFIEISNNYSNKKGQSNHATQEYKNMNIDPMHLYKWKIRLFIKAKESSCRAVKGLHVLAYRPHTMNNNIPHFHPAFQGEHFKQRQHSISHIVKIKIPRICPASQKEECSVKFRGEAPEGKYPVALSGLGLGGNVYHLEGWDGIHLLNHKNTWMSYNTLKCN